jgi:hypothetical protein
MNFYSLIHGIMLHLHWNKSFECCYVHKELNHLRLSSELQKKFKSGVLCYNYLRVFSFSKLSEIDGIN